MNDLFAPFPYFGGKRKASQLAWSRFGDVKNYVEPFCSSAAVLLAAPEGNSIETVNDADGFIVNFWRAVQADPDAVAHWADWPVTEIDLTARHGWLVNRADRLKWSLEDPDFYDAKIAGWWVWGANAWLGGEWCASRGPWRFDGVNVYRSEPTSGMKRIIPHLGEAGRGFNRKLPHLGEAGQGERPRTAFIRDWLRRLSDRLRDVRVTCGDWKRVAGSKSVTFQNGLTAIFLDPPYTHGDMNYAAGGVGGELAREVQAWCLEAGANPRLRIALCGHAGEHELLVEHGWRAESWKNGKGYARTASAKKRYKSETIWFSPACLGAEEPAASLFDEVAA